METLDPRVPGCSQRMAYCDKKGKKESLKIGNVVLVCPEERNQGEWSLGAVVELFSGCHGVVRAAKL